MARKSAATVDDRVLSLAIGDMKLAMDAGKVLEVIQRPVMSRVPNAPAVLVGIANLRGLPLPVVDLGSLLGYPARPGFPGDRVIVYDRGDTVGLLVDAVFSLTATDGAVTLADLEEWLAATFRPSVTRDRKWKPEPAQQSSISGIAEALQSFLAFGVGGQTYGLPLESVEQVMVAPEGLGSSKGKRDAIAGMMTFRDSVLPVVPLAAIVGLPVSVDMQDAGKIVVVEYEGSIVGLQVDRIDTILRLSPDAIDPVPPLLKRGAGTAELEGIGRFNAGKSLIAVLSPQKLFGHAAVETTLATGDGETRMSVSQAHVGLSVEKFLLFTLADETYGLPLRAVDEVIRLPNTVTRIPNAPDFILGVMNFRGQALPLIDQRARFGTAASSEKPRAIVVTIDDLQAGFVVDGASEIVSVTASHVAPSPNFSSEATDVFDRVAHLEIDGRMILLVDPKALLTHAERDLVSGMTGETPAAEAP